MAPFPGWRPGEHNCYVVVVVVDDDADDDDDIVIVVVVFKRNCSGQKIN